MTSVTDEDWDDALSRLQGYERDGSEWKFTGNYDTGPLGDLMARGHPVPVFISQQLGTMLDPPDTWATIRFKIAEPKIKDFRQKALEFKERYAAKMRYEKLINEKWKKEAAITKVIEEFNRKRTWVRSAIKLDIIEVRTHLYDERHFE
jgi:hypothetical protein